MKIIAFVSCLLGTVCLNIYHNYAAYRVKTIQQQHEIDSLKVMMRDIQRDSIVAKMLVDFPYRTKINTIARTIPDKDLALLINKYKKPQATKVIAKSHQLISQKKSKKVNRV